MHPALKQAFVCRSTVLAPQGRNQQSLIRDSLPSVLPPTHLHNGPFPRQYPSSLPLCWPRHLELSLQSFCRHAQEMENPCQSPLMHWQLIPRHTGCLLPGVQRGQMGWLGRERSNSHGRSSRVGSATPPHPHLYHLPTHGRAGPDQVGSPLENLGTPESQSPVYKNPPHPPASWQHKGFRELAILKRGTRQ